MKTNQVKEIVITALGIALVFLATVLIKIPNGIQGYIHLGDGFLLLFASLVNPFFAFIIGGIGSALADVAGGYAMYVIPTLFIKGLEAMGVSFIIQRCGIKSRYISYILGSLFMIAGYFIADAILNQSWQVSLTGIPSNIVQAVAGYIIALLCLPILIKYKKQPDITS